MLVALFVVLALAAPAAAAPSDLVTSLTLPVPARTEWRPLGCRSVSFAHPHEPILMISLDGATGARRFVVPLAPGQRGGGAVPLVLRDPDTGGEVVYVNSYADVPPAEAMGASGRLGPTPLPHHGAAATVNVLSTAPVASR